MQRGRVHEMSFALQCSTYVAERAGSGSRLGSGKGRVGLGLCVSISDPRYPEARSSYGKRRQDSKPLPGLGFGGGLGYAGW